MGESCVLRRDWELLPIATYLSIVNVNPLFLPEMRQTYVHTYRLPITLSHKTRIAHSLGSVDSLM